MIYVTTDSHFGHDAIHDFCNRPLDFQEKLSRYYKSLSKEDILIHLGDICFGSDKSHHENHIKPCVCKKILVRGNHDKKSDKWYLENGWDFVCDSFTNKYYGLRILFSHKPTPWDGFFDINIHGHLHDLSHRPDEKGNPMNWLISLETDGLNVQSLKYIVDKIKKKWIS